MLVQTEDSSQEEELTYILTFVLTCIQDSKKTSGANTPNKDGADTPTTKSYRG